MTITINRGGGRSSSGRGRKAERPSGFRPDIEGLRAIAVGTVLLYHAGVPWMPGGFIGVDVFFVISGFLITGVILGDMRKTGTVSLKTFYMRRAKRLLPATLVVLVAVCLMTWLLLPKTRWFDTGGDVTASALYVVNWRFAERAIDYLASDTAPSMVQHFWSLSVEEQFYFVWPCLLLVVTMRARKAKRSVERPLLIAMALVFIPSLAWSIYLTAADPARAYFVTTTRMWELALGGGLAIVIARTSSIPKPVAISLGWAGLATIIATAMVLTADTPFPGTAALIPVLGAAAVIASGRAAGKHGPVLLLGRKPMIFIGALSYSLYLWHWPLLVVADARLQEVSAATGTLVALAAVIPAYLTYRIVENPIRTSKDLLRHPERVAFIAANCTLSAAIAGLLLVLAVPSTPPTFVPPPQQAQAPTASGQPQVSVEPPGAVVLGEQPRDDPAGAPKQVQVFVPTVLQARTDRPPDQPAGCSTDQESADVTACVWGDPSADAYMALIGDSHAQQWVPALDIVARDRGLKLLVYTKANCPFTTTEVFLPVEKRGYESCSQWNVGVSEKLEAEPPSVVVVTNQRYSAAAGGQPVAEGSPELVAQGMRESWRPFLDGSIPVAVLRDTPRPNIDVPECMASNEDSITQCAVPRDEALARNSDALSIAAEGQDGVTFVDLVDAICPTDECAPVIGGVLVYRDTNHITATYARTLAPRLNLQFEKSLPRR